MNWPLAELFRNIERLLEKHFILLRKLLSLSRQSLSTVQFNLKTNCTIKLCILVMIRNYLSLVYYVKEKFNFVIKKPENANT